MTNKKVIIKTLEYILIVLVLLTISSVFTNVVLRYVFNNSFIFLQELQWHFYSALFLIGISYATYSNTHVRVDVFYKDFSAKTKNIINIVGVLIFILPISLNLIYNGYNFAYESYQLQETSSDPGGLAYRFIIKAILPIAFVMLVVASYYKAKLSLRLLCNSSNKNPNKS